MKGINKLTLVISKVFEVLHWGAVLGMAAVLVCCGTAADWFKGFISKGAIEYGVKLSVYGFEVIPADSGGNVNMKMVACFAIGAIIILSLMAMVFRNVYLIVKKSKNDTPFQNDNVRMLKEIGIFSVAVPVIGLIMSVIMRIIVGVDAVEVAVNMDGFIIGIVVFCFTQFFAQGVKLQTDVDGLL